MNAVVTDVQGSVRVNGTLSFGQGVSTDGVLIEGITLQVSGPYVGLDANFTRALAADLVAGRIIALPHDPDAGPTFPGHYQVGAIDVVRPIESLQMSVGEDSTVTIVAQLGATTLPLGLPSTATMTVHGQLRVDCTSAIAPGETGNRMDPEFTTPYCSGLRTELGLDALLAISRSI